MLQLAKDTVHVIKDTRLVYAHGMFVKLFIRNFDLPHLDIYCSYIQIQLNASSNKSLHPCLTRVNFEVLVKHSRVRQSITTSSLKPSSTRANTLRNRFISNIANMVGMVEKGLTRAIFLGI